MRLSQYYIPALKAVPTDATIISHQYSLRAGLIKQTASGIYTWLPLGLKVLQNISNIIRDEMNKSGSLEVLMPSIQPADLWRESGRYDDYGAEMLRIKDRNEREMLFGPTHEEVITDVVRSTFNSYKDLPLSFYQIQWKFRDERRPRFGVMRGREFLMKDAYSFDMDVEGAMNSYNLMFKTYIKIFKRLGLTPLAVKADTGPIGGNLSHEFHILAETGESTIYYDKRFAELISNNEYDLEEIKNVYTAADDMHNPETCNVSAEHLKTNKSIEIGQIFYFGDKYSHPMNAVFHHNSSNVAMQMGSYGIGVSRLVGGIIEAFHDEKGIVWPEEIAPFRIGLINLYPTNEKVRQVADDLYQKISKNTLYDDKDDSAGVKFARMDLLGMPWQVIIGQKSMNQNLIELKNRSSGEKIMISAEELVKRFGN